MRKLPVSFGCGGERHATRTGRFLLWLKTRNADRAYSSLERKPNYPIPAMWIICTIISIADALVAHLWRFSIGTADQWRDKFVRRHRHNQRYFNTYVVAAALEQDRA